MYTKTRRAALAFGTALALTVQHAASRAGDKVSISVNTVQLFSSLDPAKVTDCTGYMAIVNMYDGLTTVSPAGQIIPHVPNVPLLSPIACAPPTAPNARTPSSRPIVATCAVERIAHFSGFLAC